MEVYIQLYSGISTSMLISAFLDMGADLNKAKIYLEDIVLDYYEITTSIENSLDKTLVNIENENKENLCSREVKKRLNNLNYKIKSDAIKVIDNLAIAYGKDKNIALDEVVIPNWQGKVIKIVLILGLIKNLNIREIYISPIMEGIGISPITNTLVPTDEVVEILKGFNINIVSKLDQLLSLNALAIILSLSKGSISEFKIKNSSIGIGSINNQKPFKILRIFQIERNLKSKVKMMNTNIDDLSGEIMAYIMEKLMDYALDVYFTPIYMKKNRPSYNLTVTYLDSMEEEIEDLIFKNTTTLGVKKFYVETKKLDTKKVSLNYKNLDLKIKLAYYKNQTYVYPEYESVKELCNLENLSIKDSYVKIRGLWEEKG